MSDWQERAIDGLKTELREKDAELARLREALEDIAERNLPEVTAIARNALKETT